MDDKTKEMLRAYHDLVLEWNRTIPLVSRRSGAESLARIIEEVVEAGPLLPENIRTLVDIGTGAGLPGVPLAIMRPHMRAVLIDRSTKKTLFLKEVRRRFALDNLEIRCASFDAGHLDQPGPRAVTTLAVGDHEALVRITWPLLHPGDGLLLFVSQELARALADDVSCETMRWQPLAGRERTGVAWLGR